MEFVLIFLSFWEIRESSVEDAVICELFLATSRPVFFLNASIIFLLTMNIQKMKTPVGFDY